MDQTIKRATPVRSQPDQEVYNAQAERALLGKVLHDDRLWLDIADINPDAFGAIAHRKIFEAMRSLADRGARISPVTVVAEIGHHWRIDGVRAESYVTSLRIEAMESDIARQGVGGLKHIVEHTFGCRLLTHAAEQIKASALTATVGTASIEDLKAEASKLVSLEPLEAQTEDKRLGELIGDVVRQSAETKVSGTPPGIVTNFAPLDAILGPMMTANLIVIAGETGSGKTALATQVGCLLAEQGIPVRMTSLEMEANEIATRIVAARSNLLAEHIISGDLEEADYQRLMVAGEQQFDLPFWIDGNPKQSVGTIQARLARAQAKFGVRVAIIDHLQYVVSDLKRGEQHERVAQVVDDFKAMAKRLQMIVILLSHVNRSVDFSSINTAADVRRPTLSSLFGSSAIEKAADAVVFVHRPHWFLERATPNKKHQEQHAVDLEIWRGKAELVLPKRRGGKGFGVRQVYFDEEHTWFTEYQPVELQTRLAF